MASFLLIAMGAFKLAPSEAGRGGFEYWGLSSMPVYENLAQEDLRIKIFGKQRAEKLQGESIQCLRFKSGDDASCSNVYQATQPRILGIPQLFVDYYDAEKNDSFTWAMHTADATMARNPWHLLDSRTDAHTGTADNPVPVVIDKNTAMYSLKLYGGADQIFAVDYDERTIHFQVVGLLSNSILQGSLMISEKDFTRLFPNISGYRYFLSTHHKLAAWKDQMAQGNLSLMPNPEPPIGTDQILESHFNDQGLDMQSTQTLLASLLAVQNTYISAFQSLGALGLLLGTFGLATVQLRSILERRKELALMRATGYSAQRLAHLVLWENLVLLLSGLITGILAALFAVLPHMIFAQASPPGIDLLVMILIILLVGTISGFIAVRATLKAPLISALRSQ